jgi:hypothetical protein
MLLVFVGLVGFLVGGATTVWLYRPTRQRTLKDYCDKIYGPDYFNAVIVATRAMSEIERA